LSLDTDQGIENDFVGIAAPNQVMQWLYYSWLVSPANRK